MLLRTIKGSRVDDPCRPEFFTADSADSGLDFRCGDSEEREYVKISRSRGNPMASLLGHLFVIVGETHF